MKAKGKRNKIMMTYISKEPIHKGWSGDKKYCVTDLDGTKYLLRIMPFEKAADRVIDYINENRGLLANRPQTFQHGDYHIGNMMIENGRIVIIDFDRYDFGDPWEEFNRIVWCAQKAPAFASGMVDGYFEKEVPDGFWKLLALYIGSNTLSSVPWAMPFGDREIRTMLEQAKEILSWFDGMEKPIPNWYSGEAAQEDAKRCR